jgi:amino acid transporter
MTSPKLSLTAATFINLNIMVGSGIFINTVLLAHLAGSYGALTYLTVGILILPLLLSFSRLATIHRGGSLYTYGASLGSVHGFLGTWSYFLAKLASCAVALHVCVSLLQTIFPWLAQFSPLVLDSIFITLFTILNTLHAHIGKRIQIVFLAGKLLPIATIIIAGLYALLTASSSAALPLSGSSPFSWFNIVSGIPFVLYAFMGFEASCGLNHRLAHPERDSSRALMLSYSLGVIITTLFQLCFSYLVPTLGQLPSYLAAFPAFIAGCTACSSSLQLLAITLLHSGIAASAAGVAFGIMYTNSWNLYELISRGHFHRRAAWLGKVYHDTPRACVIIEGMIVLIFLLMTQGKIIILQQLAACGVVYAYFVSICALAVRESGMQRIIPACGIVSCMCLLAACIRNFVLNGLMPLFLFAGIIATGLLLFRAHQPREINES